LKQTIEKSVDTKMCVENDLVPKTKYEYLRKNQRKKKGGG
jgi:hypothetical protein